MGEADGEKGGEFETGREREELTDPKKPDTWQNNRLELLVQISSCKKMCKAGSKLPYE